MKDRTNRDIEKKKFRRKKQRNIRLQFIPVARLKAEHIVLEVWIFYTSQLYTWLQFDHGFWYLKGNMNNTPDQIAFGQRPPKINSN